MNIPWLITGIVLGFFTGILWPEPYGYNHGTEEELVGALTRPAWGAGIGLAIGLAIDIWSGIRRKRK